MSSEDVKKELDKYNQEKKDQYKPTCPRMAKVHEQDWWNLRIGVRTEVAHDGFALKMEIAEHFVRLPAFEKVNNVSINVAAKQGHHASGHRDNRWRYDSRMPKVAGPSGMTAVCKA